MADASGYVGSDACASCHANVARMWERSRHRFAMLAATPGPPLLAPEGGAGPGDGPIFARDDRLFMTGASLDYAGLV